MAVAVDNGGKSTVDLTGTSGSTASFAIANVANRTLLVWVQSSGGDFVSTVKWNTNESLTQGVKLQNSPNEWLYLYYLVNPTATTSTVDVVYSSAAVHGVLLAEAYNGCGTPTQFTSQQYTGTSITESLTVASGSWIVGGAGAQRAVSAGTGTVLRQQDAVNNNCGLGDSNGPNPASIQWTNATTTQVGLWCELPVAGAAASSGHDGRFLSLSGVGL